VAANPIPPPIRALGATPNPIEWLDSTCHYKYIEDKDREGSNVEIE